MSLLATCGCGKQYRLRNEYAGRKAKCAECGGTFVVPQPPPHSGSAALDFLSVAPQAGVAHSAHAPAEGHAPAAMHGSVRTHPSIRLHAPAAHEPVHLSPPPPIDEQAWHASGHSVAEIPSVSGAAIAAPRSRTMLWSIGGLVALLVLGGGYFGYKQGWFGGGGGGGPTGPTTPGGVILARLGPSDATAKPLANTGKVTLRPKFTPGSYDLVERMATRMNMSINAGQMRMSSTNDMTVGGAVDIAAPDPSGEQHVRFTCNRVKMDTLSEGGPAGRREHMAFDSAGPPDQQHGMLAQMMRPMVGWRGDMWARDGKFTRAEGITSLMERILMAAPPEVGPMMQQLEQQMSGFLEEMLTQHWGELLPKDAVGPGEQWKTQINVKTVPMLGPMKVDAECMLHHIEQGRGGPKAVIGFNLTADVRDRDIETPGGKARVQSLAIQQSGICYFDTAVGLSTRVVVEGNVRGNLRAEGPRGEQADLTMDVEIKADNALVPASERSFRTPEPLVASAAAFPVMAAPTPTPRYGEKVMVAPTDTYVEESAASAPQKSPAIRMEPKAATVGQAEAPAVVEPEARERERP